MTSIKPIMDKLYAKLTKPTNYMKHPEIANAFHELFDKIKRGIANPENPLDELDKAYKSKTKKSIKEKSWFGEINNEIQAVCRKGNAIGQNYQQASSSPVPQGKPSSGSKQKQAQKRGKQDSVPLGAKGHTENQLLESSKKLLEETCDMIACEVTPGYNTAEEIYVLVVAIKTKIVNIESQCLGISKQIWSLKDKFCVQREKVNGGIASMPFWKDILDSILKIKSDTDYTERSSSTGQNENLTEKHEEKVQALQKEIDDLKKELKKRTDENKTLRDDVDSIKEENKQLQKEFDKLQKELDIENRKEHMETSKGQKETTDDKKSKNKGAPTKKEDEHIDSLKNELKEEKDRSKQLKQDIKKTHEEIVKLRDNVDYWKNRVSKIAGSKLTDNNPGITDLSDPNRPTRLAEIFNELYDNVWTDTLEGLNGTKKIKTEKEAVLHMASILKVCYVYCENKFDETLEKMRGVLLLKSQKKSGDAELDQEEEKQLKDMLKSVGVRTSKCLDWDDLIKCVTDRNLQKAMQKQAFTKDFTKDMQKHQAVTKDFTQQCLEICWLMVIQDPPVVLYWGDLTVGSPIDADRFKAFTRSGDFVEYIVWPAVLLHADGPLLYKGIVQPQQSSQNTRL